MRIKNGFNIREICGDYMVVAEGEANMDFSTVISLNETAAYLWKTMKGKEFSIDDMVNALTSEYDVNEETARRDSQRIMELWNKAGLADL